MQIRVNKTKNYTVMSNYHLQDKSLSLKAKGLLCIMLSLPEDWKYSIRGLATMSSDGETAVRASLTELEDQHYLVRTPKRNEEGKITSWIYDIYEQPYEENPHVENPVVENPHVENLPLLNTNKINNKEQNTKIINNTSNEVLPQPKIKLSLYDKCYAEIENYVSVITDDRVRDELMQALIDYLSVRLSIKDKPVYGVGQWKGLLNRLNSLSEDFSVQIEAVLYSIERGYASFYLPQNTKTSKNVFSEYSIVKSVSYTADELARLEQQDKEREANGLQTKF